jgi:protein-tyrosine kinase
MDQIRSALEVESQPDVTNARAEPRRELPQEQERSMEHDRTHAPPNIVYTHTRSIELNPDHLERHRIVAGYNPSGAVAYKLLRTQVLQRMRLNNWRTLAISSPNAGAGKTVTSINLAISLAREVNQTVLLVDFDLRRPKVRKYLTDEPLKGIGEYLMDDVPLPELMFNPKGIDRLVVLPGSIAFEHSSEMLSSPKVVALAEELRARYPSRLVLFDMPPVLACDDVLAFSPHFDAALLVVEDNATGKSDLARSMHLLEHSNVLGTVLNKTATAEMGYGAS